MTWHPQIENRILAIRNGNGQIQELIIITLCLLVHVSTLSITFADGLDKIRSNKILALFVLI